MTARRHRLFTRSLSLAVAVLLMAWPMVDAARGGDVSWQIRLGGDHHHGRHHPRFHCGYPYYYYYGYGSVIYGRPWTVWIDTDPGFIPRTERYTPRDYGTPYRPEVVAYARPTERETTDYHRLGRDWAQDLRRDIITWEKFVGYVKAFIVNTPGTARDQFKKGFIAEYGVNAEEAIDKAYELATAKPVKREAGAVASDQNQSD